MACFHKSWLKNNILKNKIDRIFCLHDTILQMSEKDTIFGSNLFHRKDKKNCGNLKKKNSKKNCIVKDWMFCLFDHHWQQEQLGTILQFGVKNFSPFCLVLWSLNQAGQRLLANNIWNAKNKIQQKREKIVVTHIENQCKPAFLLLIGGVLCGDSSGAIYEVNWKQKIGTINLCIKCKLNHKLDYQQSIYWWFQIWVPFP